MKSCNAAADAPCDPKKGYVKASKVKSALRKQSGKKFPK